MRTSAAKEPSRVEKIKIFLALEAFTALLLDLHEVHLVFGNDRPAEGHRSGSLKIIGYLSKIDKLSFATKDQILTRKWQFRQVAIVQMVLRFMPKQRKSG
jgi:hypothetical protein